MVLSKDGRFLALGSEDGYLFIYHVDSGYPIGQKAPSTKHSASVCKHVGLFLNKIWESFW